MMKFDSDGPIAPRVAKLGTMIRRQLDVIALTLASRGKGAGLISGGGGDKKNALLLGRQTGLAPDTLIVSCLAARELASEGDAGDRLCATNLEGAGGARTSACATRGPNIFSTTCTGVCTEFRGCVGHLKTSMFSRGSQADYFLRLQTLHRISRIHDHIC